MGEIIYWKEFDEPTKVHHPYLGGWSIQKGEYVCKDERVKQFFFCGVRSELEDEYFFFGKLIMKNGTPWESQTFIRTWEWGEEPEEIKDKIISQAEQYLLSLNQNK